MPITSPARAGLAVATVLALGALGACSTTTDGHPVGQSGGRTGSSTGSASNTPGRSISAEKLKSTLLTAADLPSTWKSAPHDSSEDAENDDDQQLRNQLATCIGVTAPAAGDESDTLHSPDFSLGNAEIQSDASPADPAKLALLKQIIASPKTNTCLQQAIRAQLTRMLPSGASVAQLQAAVTGRQSGQPTNVVANFRATVVVKLGSTNQVIPVLITEVDLQGDAVQASVNFQSEGAAIDAATSTAALAAVSKRVAAA